MLTVLRQSAVTVVVLVIGATTALAQTAAKSPKAVLEKAVNQFAATGFAAKLALKEENGSLQIRIAPTAAATDEVAGIWVLPTTHQATVPIIRGENQGKTLTYANVVRGMV